MIILSEQTKRQIDNFIQEPTHGLLITGSEGTGKLFVAKYLASKILGLNEANIENYPYFLQMQIVPGKNVISIDQIRELKKFLKLKTQGRKRIRRVLILKDAHAMLKAAQNAILKALEEPPVDTVIILTATGSNRLIDTINSRVHEIPLTGPSKANLMKAFSSKASKEALQSAYLMSGGRVGLFSSLIQNEDHELPKFISLAKRILSMPKYYRLIEIDKIISQELELDVLLQAFSIITVTGMRISANKHDERQVRNWHSKLVHINDTRSKLRFNPNSKLLLTNLFLSI